MRRASLSVAALGAAFVLAGCGVPTQDSATPIGVDTRAPASPTPTTTVGPAGTQLWFAQGAHLVAVDAPAGVGSAGELLAQLAAGPPPGSPGSMRSLLDDPAHGGTLLSLPEEEARAAPSGLMTVSVSDAFNSLPAEEQVLLLGQVVLTLGGAGAEAVLVTDAAGKPLAIPLPDGRLLDDPARPTDYLSLTT